MTNIEITSIYLPTAIAVVFLIAICFLWSLKTREAEKTIAALTALYVLAWIDPIWSDPWLSMWYEIIIFICMWISLKSLTGVFLSLLTMIMAINNGIFEISGGFPLYRMSVVSIIFVLQCAICIGASYYTHYQRGKEKGGKYGHIQAMQGIIFNLSHMGKRS